MTLLEIKNIVSQLIKSLALITAREISPTASCGLPDEECVSLKHMIKDHNR